MQWILIVENTLNKLNEIAHLPLGIEFDQNLILQEIEKLPYKLEKYRSALSNDRIMDIHDEERWDSIALYSIDGNVKSNPAEPWTGDFVKTDAIKLCPYLDSILQSVGGGKLLARIEVFSKGGSAGWHSHVKEAGQPEWISVWNLPIMMPKESKYSVISYMDYRGSDYLNPIKVYEKWYKPGSIYCLNSYHYHNAFNYSDNPMIMVRFYVDTRDTLVQTLLEQSIKAYKEELIPTYEEYISSLGDS
jgi:hypothetical protein